MAKPGAGRPSPLAAALRTPDVGLLIGISAIVGLISFLDPSRNFFSVPTQLNLLRTVSLFGVLAVGAAIVIIAGGIDLSIGAVVALSSVVAAKLMTEWLPGAGSPSTSTTVARVAATVAITLSVGVLIGLFHALLIYQVKLPPFIATLATMAGLRSVAVVLSQNRGITVANPTFRMLGNDYWFSVPIFLSVAVAASVMMGATVLGRHLYALGGNEAAARLSGLSIGKLQAVAYGTSGMLAALGGLLFTGYTGQGKGTLGVSYELYAITAAVVGGCSLSGGVGTVRGTVLGLILIQVVIKGTGLVVRDIDSTQIEGLVLGTVVVVAVAVNQGTLIKLRPLLRVIARLASRGG